MVTELENTVTIIRQQAVLLANVPKEGHASGSGTQPVLFNGEGLISTLNWKL